MDQEIRLITIKNWVIRIRYPDTAGLHPCALMLHGWTGDENSMWIFASRMPKKFLLIAPRGIYRAPLDGYGWHPPLEKAFPSVNDFLGAVQELIRLLIPKNFPEADLNQIHLVGFSQGAALCYAFSLLHPERIIDVAGLSGFVPEGSDDYIKNQPLLGKRIFAAHGSLDKLVPVDYARRGLESLEKNGAEVTYCEDNVGHKLSLTCFKSLQMFYQG